uniref:Uncharacterized protein n=1 Tax=Arundo donax TaxID=35708 RepID=A0A0A9DCW4_ARUDO
MYLQNYYTSPSMISPFLLRNMVAYNSRNKSGMERGKWLS